MRPGLWVPGLALFLKFLDFLCLSNVWNVRKFSIIGHRALELSESSQNACLRLHMYMYIQDSLL